MAPLGFFVLWAGYTLGIFGFSKIKSAYSSNPLSLSDLALPSHRTTYIAAATTWTQASTTTPSAGGGAQQNASATASSAKSSTVPSPTPTPSGPYVPPTSSAIASPSGQYGYTGS